jgi:hypothetical protein
MCREELQQHIASSAAADDTRRILLVSGSDIIKRPHVVCHKGKTLDWVEVQQCHIDQIMLNDNNNNNNDDRLEPVLNIVKAIVTDINPNKKHITIQRTSKHLT